LVDQSAGIGTFAAFGEFDGGLESAEALGVDSGATLVKLCVRDRRGERHFATWPSPSTERVGELVGRLAPDRVGVTGCGSADILATLTPERARPAANLIEFDAWGRGANELLSLSGQATGAPYLLVSIGTGTSALRVDGDRVERVGGTALGGGAALGLGYALTGCRSHDELTALAARGNRGHIDLLISDIYAKNAIPIAGEATAASFGKLARALEQTSPATGAALLARREDLAAAIMVLVAENIALIANASARLAGVTRIVYGGSTLHDNPRIVETVRLFSTVMGFEAIVLPRSGHAGALGAMLLAA
jgi:type II pantothenate kinase